MSSLHTVPAILFPEAQPNSIDTETESTSSLTLRWASAWAEITGLLASGPQRDQPEFIPWCKKIRDLVSDATDIYIVQTMRGASVTFQVTSQLAAVLETWEQDAFAWGFNPGCWSSFGPPTGCTSAVKHSEHRGPVTIAPHFMAPNLPPDQNMDPSMSDVTREMTEAEAGYLYFNTHLFAPAGRPTEVLSSKYTCPDEGALYTRLQKARDRKRRLKDTKQALQCEVRELTARVAVWESMITLLEEQWVVM